MGKNSLNNELSYFEKGKRGSTFHLRDHPKMSGLSCKDRFEKIDKVSSMKQQIRSGCDHRVNRPFLIL